MNELILYAPDTQKPEASEWRSKILGNPNRRHGFLGVLPSISNSERTAFRIELDVLPPTVAGR